MALGLSLEQVVPMVTSNAAEMLGMSERDRQRSRSAARPTFRCWTTSAAGSCLRDNEKNRSSPSGCCVPRSACGRAERFDADAPILPAAVAA